jgi:hypothetical protein
MVSAQRNGSIVINTPEAIKSLLLKYIDELSSVERASEIQKISASYLKLSSMWNQYQAESQQLKASEQCADDLKDIIQLWGAKKKGVLILDEVDLILNPLKSELNFPIGSDFSVVFLFACCFFWLNCLSFFLLFAFFFLILS